jgi:hypothetical protein
LETDSASSPNRATLNGKTVVPRACCKERRLVDAAPGRVARATSVPPAKLAIDAMNGCLADQTIVDLVENRIDGEARAIAND